MASRHFRFRPWWVPAAALVLAVAVDIWYGEQGSAVTVGDGAAGSA